MSDLSRKNIVRVDLDKPLQRTDVGTLIASGDKLANRFGALVYASNAQADLTGCSVMGYFIRPHGSGETVTINGTVSGHTAYVDLPQACYLYSGAFALAIKLTKGTMTHTLRVIDGYVRTTSTDSIIDSDNVIPSLEDLLAEIDDIDAAKTAANTAAASATCAAAAATSAAESATSAAASATSAAAAANAAAESIDDMTVSASELAAGASPTVTITDVDGHKAIAFAIPKGDKGDQGIQGIQGVPGAGNVSTVNDVVSDSDGNVALTGADIPVSGTDSTTINAKLAAMTAAGVPTGGTAGQVLTKASGTDHDVGWADPTVPVFGSAVSAGLSLAAGATVDVSVPDVPDGAVILGMYSTQYAVSCNYGGKSGTTVTCRCRNNGTSNISTMYVYVSYVTGGGAA